MTPIIDTHQHLWHRDQFRLPWIEPGSVLDRDYTVADYLDEAQGLDIAMTVYMEVDVAEEQQADEAAWAVDMCRNTTHPTVAAVVSGRPASPVFERYLSTALRAPEIVGLRQVLHGKSTPPGYCLQPAFIRGIQGLGERGLTFDLCMRAAELPDAAMLIDECPETEFVLDHCGNPQILEADQSAWMRDIAMVAERPNVVCKISGILASARPGQWTATTIAPFVNRCVEVFGHDRVLFGGDWPVCWLAASLEEWVTALREVVSGWSPEDRRKLFYSNAMRVYRLGEP